MFKEILILALLSVKCCGAALDTGVCRHPAQPAASGGLVVAPVQLQGGAVLIDVQLNGRGPFSFQLDSGFQNSVIDSTTARRLGLTTKGARTSVAPGGEIRLSRVEGVSVIVAGIPLRSNSFAVTDFSGLAPFFGHSIDGVLGFDFFEQFVVILDYDRLTLKLCDPASFSYKGNGESVPIDLSTRQPYIQARIAIGDQEPVEAAIEIDTGKVDPFSLNLKFAQDQRLFKTKNDLLAVRGTSLGGHTDAWIGRAKTLRWGHISLETPIVGFADERIERRGGQIGFGVLRRFRLVFDYSRRLVIFEPNARLLNPYEFDHAGMILVSNPSSGKLNAFLVIVGSPAAEAGIHDGDEISAIDGVASTRFSLLEARDYFEKATGRHALTIRRGDKSFLISVLLRPML